MLKLILTILSILIISLAAIASSAEDKYTPEQKKDLAKGMGIILIGFTKQDVRDTFSFTEPDIWYTKDGQEVWYYPSPEAQHIYFIENTVEEVKYTSKKRLNESSVSNKNRDM